MAGLECCWLFGFAESSLSKPHSTCLLLKLIWTKYSYQGPPSLPSASIPVLSSLPSAKQLKEPISNLSQIMALPIPEPSSASHYEESPYSSPQSTRPCVTCPLLSLISFPTTPITHPQTHIPTRASFLPEHAKLLSTSGLCFCCSFCLECFSSLIWLLLLNSETSAHMRLPQTSLKPLA